jgi:hypothetical protein
MNDAWRIISTELLKHAAVYIAAVEGLCIAAICCWPVSIPKSAQEWWTWVRDTFQTVIPAARHSAAKTNP